MDLLEGKIAIITGGTSGIGARATEVFAEAGATVIVAGRRRAEGEAIASRLGSKVSFFQADVTKEVQFEALFEHVVSQFGRVDCLFNNAGGGGPRAGDIAEIDMSAFDAHMDTNLRSAIIGMKYAARIMKRQRSGSIINTASLAGLRAGYSALPYSTAKAGLIHATRVVAAELGPFGIRVNSISPGGIVTSIFGKGGNAAGEADDEALGRLRALLDTIQPIPRAGGSGRHCPGRAVPCERRLNIHHGPRSRRGWGDGVGERLADILRSTREDRGRHFDVIRPAKRPPGHGGKSVLTLQYRLARKFGGIARVLPAGRSPPRMSDFAVIKRDLRLTQRLMFLVIVLELAVLVRL